MKNQFAQFASAGLNVSAKWFVKGFKWYYFAPKAPQELSKK
jgi:hypothetical protein